MSPVAGAPPCASSLRPADEDLAKQAPGLRLVAPREPKTHVDVLVGDRHANALVPDAPIPQRPRRVRREARQQRGAGQLDEREFVVLHQPAADYIHGYQKLEAAYKAGKLRAIGISDFNADEVEEVVEKCEVVPAVIQVECHPYFPQTELRRALAKHGIALQAWYPLGGRGNASIMEEPVIAELAEEHGKTAAQVIMRWHVQMGNIVIPGSKTESHILDNLDVFDFELSDTTWRPSPRSTAATRFITATTSLSSASPPGCPTWTARSRQSGRTDKTKGLSLCHMTRGQSLRLIPQVATR